MPKSKKPHFFPLTQIRGITVGILIGSMIVHSLIVVHDGATYLVRLNFSVVNGVLQATVVSVLKVAVFTNPNE